MQHRFNYNWTLADANFTKDKGKVFSCFACGGGSTMGYKLAGFDVIGCNEIDPKMMQAYIENHKPKYSFLEPIQTFKLRDDLPKELYELDILDGSPPCSNFSMAGNREKDWGKLKKFREGQSKQVLDTLFFDFIDLAKKLQPKIVIAENVKGLLLGNAKKYVIEIYKQFESAGYYCQHFLLDASKMGVPQRRERVFFIALRKDLAEPYLYQKDMFTIMPKLKMEFKEKPILFGEVMDKNDKSENLAPSAKALWDCRLYKDRSLCDVSVRNSNKENFFSHHFEYIGKIPYTIKSDNQNLLYDYPRLLNNNEIISISSFPKDYNFLNNKTSYLCGMSVPPVMMANIATEIYNQWNGVF